MFTAGVKTRQQDIVEQDEKSLTESGFDRIPSGRHYHDKNRSQIEVTTREMVQIVVTV